MTVSDSGAPMLMGGGDGFCGGGFIWAFLIFALLMGNGGWGGWGNGNGNGNSNAIQNDINRGFDNQNSMANQREILSAVSNGTAQSVAATNQVYHDIVENDNDKYMELQRDIAAVRVAQANALANQNECCCSTKMTLMDGFERINANIAQSRYEAAMNGAAQTQKVLDALSQNKIDALQSRVGQLELERAMCGVVRYPNGMTYNAGQSPFCGCNNGYNGCNGYPLYAA